jgi:hypothetical protein
MKRCRRRLKTSFKPQLNLWTPLRTANLLPSKSDFKNLMPPILTKMDISTARSGNVLSKTVLRNFSQTMEE